MEKFNFSLGLLLILASIEAILFIGCWSRVQDNPEEAGRCCFDQPTTVSADALAVKQYLLGKRLKGLSKQNPVNYMK